jgi:NTP pyrophosphatase (non-canonical NTP hydrolase)
VGSRHSTAEVLEEVAAERARQDATWGEGNPLYRDATTALAVLVEEVGEMAQATLEGDLDNLRLEAIQVAAVAVAIAEQRRAHQ